MSALPPYSYVQHGHDWYPQRSEGIRPTGTAGTDGCELPCNSIALPCNSIAPHTLQKQQSALNPSALTPAPKRF